MSISVIDHRHSGIQSVLGQHVMADRLKVYNIGAPSAYVIPINYEVNITRNEMEKLLQDHGYIPCDAVLGNIYKNYDKGTDYHVVWYRFEKNAEAKNYYFWGIPDRENSSVVGSPD